MNCSILFTLAAPYPPVPKPDFVLNPDIVKKLLTLFCIYPALIFAQDSHVSKLDLFLASAEKFNNFNGNVLIAKGGKLIYEKSIGFSNLTTKEKLTSNSMFELASLTKPFVATAIFQLKEKGKLSLSDTLRKFIPELPYQNVTIYQMLSHTSGLPDVYEAMDKKWDRKKFAYNQDVIDFLASEKIPPDFAPGSKCEYSNVAYELLAVIVEKASGQSFATYVQENICKPLGLKNTRVYNTRRTKGEKIPGYAYGYVNDSARGYILPDSLIKYAWVVYPDGIYGSGNISSTAGDLYLFDRALKENKFFTSIIQDEMQQSRTLWDTTYKIYFSLSSQKVGMNEFGRYIHTGVAGWPGYKNDMIRYTRDDLVIIVLSNNESNAGYISGALAYIMNDQPVVNAYEHKEYPIESKHLNRFEGAYTVPYVPDALTITIFKKDKKLYYQPVQLMDRAVKSEPIELTPESPNKFFLSKGEDIQIEFALKKSGKVDKAYFILYNMKKEMVPYRRPAAK